MNAHSTNDGAKVIAPTDKRLGKIKPRRPIILLRRSSCGSLAAKQSASNSISQGAPAANQINKLPRLKSMSEIECMATASKNPLSDTVDLNNNVKKERLDDPMLVGKVWANSSQVNNVSTGIHSLDWKQTAIQSVNPLPPTHNFPIKIENLAQPFPQAGFCPSNPDLVGQRDISTSSTTNYKPYQCPARLRVNQAPFLKNSYLMPYDNGQSSSAPSVPQNFIQDARTGNFYSIQENEVRGMFPCPTDINTLRPDVNAQYASNPLHWTQTKNLEGYEAAVVDDSLTNITWLGRMGVNNFLPMKVENETRCFLPFARDDKIGRPPYSYMALIQFAINSSPTRRMTLRQIYMWIEEKFPYFKHAKPGWKNSIRHNLSLHDIFVREVSSTSKSSFWTLRPDLNMRPLTLESVKGGNHHAFQTCQSEDGAIWSVQTINSGQKPLLPRLPSCSQPYILLPVPLATNSPNKMSEENHPTNNSSLSFHPDCSSVFADSGIHSDMSMMTPSASRSKILPGHLFPSLGDAASSAVSMETGKLEDTPGTNSESSAGDTKCIKTSSRKRARKEPLKIINNSLNSSLHFIKEDMESLLSSPEALAKSPESRNLGKGKLSKSKENQPVGSLSNGLCDNSFSEMMNDLGSPFQNLFSRNHIPEEDSYRNNTPPRKRSRKSKLQRSFSQNGYSPRSSAVPLTSRSKDSAICVTPEKRFHDEAIESQDDLPHQPTSTPVGNNKLMKKPSFGLFTPPSESGLAKLCNIGRESKSPRRKCIKANLIPDPASPAKIPTPQMTSPILRSALNENAEITSDLINDLMGVMFKTPDQAGMHLQQFNGLTPENGKIAFPNLSELDKGSIAGSSCSSAAFSNMNLDSNSAELLQGTNESPSRGFLPSIFGGNSNETSVLNNSFGKLLDLSGISLLGGAGCPTSQLADLADISWSNLTNI